MTNRFESLRRVLAAAVLLAVGAAAPLPAVGQESPAVLAQDDPDAVPAPDDPASTAALVVRISRLEGQLRALTGQVEQLQFQNRKLEDELRKMSQDVDFRFQDLGRTPAGGARPAAPKRGDTSLDPGAAAPAAGNAAADLPAPSTAAEATPRIIDEPAAKPQRRTDAFDPSSDPAAPGAPKPLGTTAPSEPLPTRTAAAVPSLSGPPHAPLDLTPGGLAAKPAPAVQPADRTASIPPTPDLRGTASAAAGPTAVPGGGAATGTAKADYDTALALYKSGQYDAAMAGFQDFLQKYPKDRSLPDATYFLGDTYARLGRHREAAEQFLKLSTDYTRSARAPDALLRLGVALNALGAKEQACATYQEVDRKYPAAPADVRAGVERELKRARC